MIVSDFPLPPERAIEIIKGLANTKYALVPEKLAEGKWPNKVFHLQVKRCLEDGEILSGPHINEHGHYVYKMKRVAAGQEIYLTAVLFKQRGEWHVAVTEVQNGDY